MSNQLKLEVNGQEYSGWESIKVQKGVKAIASDFSLSVAHTSKGILPFKKNDECKIKINNTTILTGYIESIEDSTDPSSRSISLSGRSVSSDLIDSSCFIDKYSFTNVSIKSLIERIIKPFGLSLEFNSSKNINISNFNINPGEAVFDVLDRLSGRYKLIFSGGPKRNIIVNQGFSDFNNEPLVEGKNIISKNFSTRSDNLFSHYIVKGQQSGSDDFFGARSNSSKYALKDNLISRYRPLEIIMSGQVDNEMCQKRAEWELRNRRANSESLKVKVQGWTQSDGKLWQPGQVVNVNILESNINKNQLVISEIGYMKDSSGTFTEMRLEHIDAFESEPESPSVEKNSFLSGDYD